MITLEEYKERLNKHDWYYMMSDDSRIYEAGSKEEKELKNLSLTELSFANAYDEKRAEIFNKENIIS